MALILAIESDRRQVNQLTAIVRGKLHAELVLGDTAEAALERLGDRVPDLVLTSALLSPRDEQALGNRLRRLNGVAAHVQMLTLPVFASPTKSSAPRGGVLSALLGDRGQEAVPDGCDPSMFAEQCREYLERSAAERQAKHQDALPAPAIEPDPSPIIAAVAALEAPIAIEEPVTKAVERAPADDTNDGVPMDIDLSDLLEDSSDEAPVLKTAADVDDEPSVYELSADTIEIDADVETAAAVTAASADEPGPAAPEPAAEDFDDWQRVVDALRRESQHVRVPRDRKPNEPATEIAAAPPPPPVPAPKPSAAAAAEPPRRRQPRVAHDEWGMFDPAQAGMAALYARLEELTEEDEKPARPA